MPLRQILIAASIAASIAGSLVTPALAQMDHSGHGAAVPAISPASHAYMDAMAKMDGEMKRMTMSGKPGVDFAVMMIPHHQAAIDMAKAYLASDEADAELVALSKDIVAAQEREIVFLRRWLQSQGHH
jgi:uncharacterized protein (DUF305 family)